MEMLDGRDLIGQLLNGRYRVEKSLGKGGCGTVYAATHVVLGAKVAVKVLNPGAAGVEHALKDFLAEAKLLTNVDHENIVRWITFDKTEDGLYFFVMEHLEGKELSKLLKEEGGKLPWKRAARILLQVLAALQRAHNLPDGKSLLHLDLKPQNVFICRNGDEGDKVKVIDFGIGQHIGAEALVESYGSPLSLEKLKGGELEQSIATVYKQEKPSRSKGTTVRRARGGTPIYASPEQCAHLAGHPDIIALDGRSDLYSLGVMAFRMLTGELPFERCETFADVFRNHLEVPPRTIGSTGVKVPRTLERFVDQCLVKDREKRWESTEEAYQALERIVHPPQRVLKVMVPLVVTLALATWAAVAWFLEPPPPPHGLVLVETKAAVEALYLGDRSAAEELRIEDWERIEGLEPNDPRRKLTLMQDESDGTSEVAGWNLAWVDEDHGMFSIVRSDQEAPTAGNSRVFVEWSQDGDPIGRSKSFSIYYIPTWRVDEPEVLDHTKDRLDPSGQTLRVKIQGDLLGRRVIDGMVVKQGEETVYRSTDPPLEYETYSEYRVALDALKGQEEAELTVEIRDRADQVVPVVKRLLLASEPVRIQNARFGIRAAEDDGDSVFQPIEPWEDNRYYLDCDHAYQLEITLNRMADLRFKVTPWKDFRAPTDLGKKTYYVGLETLGLTPEVSSFRGNGSIELWADDARFVDRKDPRDSRYTVPIHFNPEIPELEARLHGEILQEAGPSYTNIGEKGTLEVHRVKSDRKLRLKASCILEGAEREGSEGEGDLKHSDSRDALVRMQLDFPTEGVYTISVTAYQLQGDTLGAPVGPVRTYPVFVDRKEPTLAFLPAKMKLIKRGDKPALELTIDDASPVASVHCELTGPDKDPVENVPPPVLSEGAPARFVPELWAENGPASLDGEYRLLVTVKDAAGNEGQAAYAWQIAYKEPTIKLRRPRKVRDGRYWNVGEDWEIAATVEDPNAIKSVIAWVTNLDKQDENRITLTYDKATEMWLTPQPKPIDATWSEEKVEIRVTARDRGGNKGSSPDAVARLPYIDPRFPDCVALEASPGRKMMLVRTNADFTYRAGGRENEALPEGLDQELDKEYRYWNLEIKAGRVRDYYLDETEVSRGQYLEFVQAGEDGYLKSSRWPTGEEPSQERWEALESELGKADPDLPITDVSWDEAFAYARWAEKRLPTLLEWEYAVRGGGAYRFDPCGQDPRAAKQEDRTPAGNAWTAAGIHDLASGVREWTCTARPLDPRKAPAVYYAENLDGFIESESEEPGHERRDRYWAAGACDETGEFSFREKFLHWRDTPDPDIGFRCALDAMAVHRRIGKGAMRPCVVEGARTE